MGLVKKAFSAIGEITDKSSKHFYDWGHYCTQRNAFCAAEKDDFKLSPEMYWNVAKAYYSLRILGSFTQSNGRLDWKQGKLVERLDEEDKEIIELALSFGGGIYDNCLPSRKTGVRTAFDVAVIHLCGYSLKGIRPGEIPLLPELEFV